MATALREMRRDRSISEFSRTALIKRQGNEPCPSGHYVDVQRREYKKVTHFTTKDRRQRK